jgi:hypothetical protein
MTVTSKVPFRSIGAHKPGRKAGAAGRKSGTITANTRYIHKASGKKAKITTGM